MFNVSLVGEDSAIVHLDAIPRGVHDELLKSTTKLAIQLQSRIVTQKLAGQVLGQRSGALARSIQEEVQDEGAAVYGRVYSAGDVKYARFWEKGFHGVETVRAHMRTTVFGQMVEPFSVGPFSRNVDQAARPFMGPSLHEMHQSIADEYAAAVRRGLRK